jgi:hypothetical protein
MQDILNKPKYFDALGALVNFCLTSVMGDILALSDITEVESHRLSELCRILHALEGLFVDTPEQVRSYLLATFTSCTNAFVATLCCWVRPSVAQILVSFRALGKSFLLTD